LRKARNAVYAAKHNLRSFNRSADHKVYINEDHSSIIEQIVKNKKVFGCWTSELLGF